MGTAATGAEIEAFGAGSANASWRVRYSTSGGDILLLPRLEHAAYVYSRLPQQGDRVWLPAAFTSRSALPFASLRGESGTWWSPDCAPLPRVQFIVMWSD